MPTILTLLRYYVARCRLCGWQWAITDEQSRLALKGCPACGSGVNMVEIQEEGDDD